MWSPDPSCRKCERHPAGNAVLLSARSVFLTAHFCGGPRNLPASEEAPSMSEAYGWTSDCRTPTEQEINWLWHTSNILSDVWFTAFGARFKCLHSECSKFTSVRGSSWALVQRCHPLQGKRTCFHCSVASGQMSPTVCCYRCWGRLLPGSLFSSTHPRKTTKPQKQVKSGCTGTLLN